MIYLTSFILFILISLSNIIFANDNKIIFEVNNEIFSSVDLKNRIKYLEVINSKSFDAELKTELMNDYFKSVVFFEYVKKNNFLNNILIKETEKIFTEIISNNKINKYLNKEIVKNNINYDFARKIVLENILENYKQYIFNNPKDINFIYNYRIKYITIPTVNLLNNKEFNKILNTQNFNKLNIYLNDKKIDYHTEDVEIKDLNKISTKVKNLFNFNNQFLFEQNLNFYRIIKIEKKLDISNGLYYRLINFETNRKLLKDQENCNYIKSLNNIKSSKEYEFNKLNNKIKNNLISINDYIIFQNNNNFTYIFLCEIRVNDDFLEEININKKINFIAKDIEIEFINKYSKLFNAKKYYK